jgi:hypothetical protein
MTYLFNSDGSVTANGAVPDGVTDNGPIIQAAVDWLYNNYGGGRLWLPHPGNYMCRNLVLKGSVTLLGHGRGNTSLQSQNADFSVVTLDASVNYGGFKHLFVIGFTDHAAKTNAVNVADNVPAIIDDCSIWGGSSALFTRGMDGRYSNLFLLGWGFANLVSNGANWYSNVKMDDAAHAPRWAFYQGTPVMLGVMENTFVQCDFSGAFSDGSVGIYDGGTSTALTRFLGCITSHPIKIGGSKHTGFTNHEFGSPVFVNASGTVSVAGSYAFSPMTIPGLTVNTNIIVG